MVGIIVSFISAFFLMEFIAWAAHKYLMHGPLWFVHQGHHTPGPGFFQRNDLFFLIFATPSWLSIQFGMMYHWPMLASFGFGFMAYGAAYAVVHEMIIHRRFAKPRVPQGKYWARIVREHKRHHQSKHKEGAINFGLLWFPRES